ncbi:HipA domain-containing protein [Longimicrobium sp.]|uniref:HipA domain-containing protein n=1 Tax=Longimicrobium sp. TaxID=2029185 RepID=UPI003B3AA55E
MKTPPMLAVLLDRAVVGQVEPLPGSRLYRLRYSDAWMSDADAYPVSLALPLAAPEHEGLPVRHWLRGLLPDNEGRLQEIEREFGASRDDPYAMLAHVGEDCVGAVQFATPERVAAIVRGAALGGVEWLDDARLERLLRDVAARLSPDLRVAHTGQFSLPGALGKVALVCDPDTDRWGLPSGQRASTHILKPPLPGVVGHNENEHFCLRLARAAGLAAATSRVVRVGEQGAIAVERYDRRPDARGEVRRLHQEDMAQALGLDPALRYAGEGGAGIREIVRLLRDYATSDDVDAFILGVAYAWITAGTDAHLRNFSLLIQPGEDCRLAPLYDVASALGLITRSRQRRELRIAMAIGGTTVLGDIDRAAWAREAELSRLPRRLLGEVGDLAARVAEAAPRVVEQLVEQERLDAKYLQRLGRDVAARANGCALEFARLG